MARRKNGYVEPADFFPPDVRKMFEDRETEESKATEEKPKKDPYREGSKRLIESERKKKAAAKK